MGQRKLFHRAFFRALLSLPPHRRSDFAQYISLPQFNPQPRLHCLLQRILEAAESSRRDDISLADLGAPCGLAANTVEKSLSQLYSLLQDFVLVHACLASGDYIHMLPFEAWEREGLPEDLLEREARRRQRKLEQLPASDTRLHARLLLESSLAKRKAQQPRKKQASLFDQHLGMLDEYYALSRLKYTCAAANTARIFGQGDPAQYLEHLPDFSTRDLSPLASAYRMLLSLIAAPSPQPQAIAECLSHLRKLDETVDREDRSDLFGYLLNTGFRGMATGKPAFAELVHDIYASLLQEGLLLDQGLLNPVHYKNVVSVKVRTGRVEEARRFAREGQALLPQDDRAILLPLCVGLIEFHEGNFREAIREFAGILRQAPDDLFWGLEARSMLWKAYFEAYESLSPQEHHEMLRLYDSFRTFVARNRSLSDYHRTGYQNFIRLFNRLIQLTEQEDAAFISAGLRELLGQAREMELVANKQWVLQAIEKKIAVNEGRIR